MARFIGVLIGFLLTSTVLYAQAPKITATGGWNLCVDVAATSLAQAQSFGVQLAIDGAAAVPAAGVTWVGTASPFSAQLPLSQMQAAARAVGTHAAVITITAPAGSPIVLADGSVLTTSPGLPLTVPYEVVAQPVGPTPSNPRWIKIAGTIAAILLGLWAWRG